MNSLYLWANRQQMTKKNINKDRIKDFIKKQYDFEESVYDILLTDITTAKNVIFANKDYEILSGNYCESAEIPIDLVIPTKENPLSNIIPRFAKLKIDHKRRNKNNAEVFTENWIVNLQYKLIEEERLKCKDPFNDQEQDEREYRTNYTPIDFSKTACKQWESYVVLKCLEICCGEGPYITTRYVASTGEYIEPFDRAGFLDRKLRVVSENTKTKTEFFQWSILALRACYGFEYQGDNLFLARKNILSTLIDFYKNKFLEEPELPMIMEWALTTTFNFWQMDGLRYEIPFLKIQPLFMDWEQKSLRPILEVFPQVQGFVKEMEKKDKQTEKRAKKRGQKIPT